MPPNTVIVRDESLRKRVLDLIAALSIDTPWVISWKRYRNKRTLSQNNYLHMIIDVFGEHVGHTPAEMKQVLKEVLLTPRIVMFRGAQRKIWPSTSDMDTADLAAFIDGIHRIAGEQGIMLPVPEEGYGT